MNFQISCNCVYKLCKQWQILSVVLLKSCESMTGQIWIYLFIAYIMMSHKPCYKHPFARSFIDVLNAQAPGWICWTEDAIPSDKHCQRRLWTVISVEQTITLILFEAVKYLIHSDSILSISAEDKVRNCNYLEEVEGLFIFPLAPNKNPVSHGTFSFHSFFHQMSANLSTFEE